MQELSKIPNWLKIVKNYYPDFIIRNPEVRFVLFLCRDFPAAVLLWF